MKRTVSEGIYQDDAGRFSYRPKNARTGRRTEKRLKARTLRLAILEHAKLLAATPGRIALDKLAALYSASHCPDRRGLPRPAAFCDPEDIRIRRLTQYFGHFPAEEIQVKECLEYKLWRQRRIERDGCTGERAIDKELTTLSNLLNYGVLTRQIPINYIHSGRPRFRTREKIVSCRQRAPVSGDELHRLAHNLLSSNRAASQVLGWQLLFEALTGCRTSEILRLRFDAPPQGAGYIETDWLWLQRSKHGVNPYALIHPDLNECLAAHRAWHRDHFPKSPWYFPSAEAFGKKPVCAQSLTHALRRAAAALGMPHRTSHGLRSYYVTVRRSRGIPDAQIAAEIGDKSGAVIIAQTYGGIPENWRGGDHLTFRPKSAAPAWTPWLPKNIVSLPVKAAKIRRRW